MLMFHTILNHNMILKMEIYQIIIHKYRQNPKDKFIFYINPEFTHFILYIYH